MDTLFLAELEELPLGVLGVEFNLVDRRDKAACLQLFEVGDRKVGDSNGFDFVGLEELLHGLVCLHNVNILEEKIALSIPCNCHWS
jgi:hypothetical protein